MCRMMLSNRRSVGIKQKYSSAKELDLFPRRQLVSLMNVKIISDKSINELSRDCPLAPGNLPEVRQDVVKPLGKLA